MADQPFAILCVDDEKIVLDSLQQQLKTGFNNEYMCEIAESAEEAWEVIEELVDDGFKVILVISDWLMPVVKGDKFLVDVHQKFPDTSTILLSGQADESAIQNAYENASLHAYIKKPWKPDELLKTVQEAIQSMDN